MPYRVGQVVFGNWESLEIAPGRFADVFVFPLSYRAGLMPSDYSQAIRNIVPTVNRLRRKHSALWIKLESPEAPWFFRELRRSLRGIEIPIAITIGDRQPELNDFSYQPYTEAVRQRLAPPWVDPVPRQGVTDEALACLRVLTRLDSAFKAEIASLTALSEEKVEAGLRVLEEKNLVGHVTPAPDSGRTYPYWEIRRAGKSLALRSWGVPQGFVFTRYRAANSSPEGEHRRKSRLWPAWLRRSWGGGAEIYAGWTEAKIMGTKVRPDGLCWGKYDGLETLFWLEVESGHSSRTDIQDKLYSRMRAATYYSAEMKVNLVFCVLGMPWVRQAASLAFAGLLRPWTAVIIADWQQFGVLPLPRWGMAQTQFPDPE